MTREVSKQEKVESTKTNKNRLASMFIFTFAFFLVEIIVGYFTNSMALVADSFHMLSDVAALVVAFISVKMSPKKWSKNTFGWARAEILGALVNAVFLAALCFSIIVESVKRFVQVEKIEEPLFVLYVGIAGLVVNLVGLFLFHPHHGAHNHHHHSTHAKDSHVSSKPERASNRTASHMNIHGVFLHILADALGSVVVIISARIVWKTNWSYKDYVDPALSLFLVILILSSTWPLLHESAMILLQTVPSHIQIDELQRELIRDVEGVVDVHELHIWTLAGDKIIASVHLCCRNLADYIKISEDTTEFFHNAGIHSTTLQIEFFEQNISPDECHCYLTCTKPGSAGKCAAKKCCSEPITYTNIDAVESNQNETINM